MLWLDVKMNLLALLEAFDANVEGMVYLHLQVRYAVKNSCIIKESFTSSWRPMCPML